MGGSQSVEKNNKISFDDVKFIIKNNSGILISTLKSNEQECLIEGTVPIQSEEKLINKYLIGEKNISIIIYGKNCSDDSIIKKYEQLCKLGFPNVYIYVGGIFEWLLLQDIYGDELFPTTTKELDILKYKCPQQFNILMLEAP